MKKKSVIKEKLRELELKKEQMNYAPGDEDNTIKRNSLNGYIEALRWVLNE